LKVDRRIADVTAKDGPVAAVVPVASKQGVPRLKEFCELQWRKAPQRKAPLGPTATPLNGEVAWAEKEGVHTITGNVMVGENPANYGHKRPGSKATLRLEAGCFVDGGAITVSDGLFDAAGDAAHPVVIKNVKFVVETGALLKATNTIFENCSFSKGGSLRAGSFNAKFELADCLLIQTVFEKLNQADYGLKITGCTMIDGKMPNRVNNPGSNIDTLKTVTHEWSTIVDNDFYNCEFSVSSVWCLRRCNLYSCLLTSEEGIYQSDTGSLKITLGMSREDAGKLIPDLTTRTSNNRTGKLTYEVSPALFAHKTFPSQ
jgi:hypothetical protein